MMSNESMAGSDSGYVSGMCVGYIMSFPSSASSSCLLYHGKLNFFLVAFLCSYIWVLYVITRRVWIPTVSVSFSHGDLWWILNTYSLKLPRVWKTLLLLFNIKQALVLHLCLLELVGQDESNHAMIKKLKNLNGITHSEVISHITFWSGSVSGLIRHCPWSSQIEQLSILSTGSCSVREGTRMSCGLMLALVLFP